MKLMTISQSTDSKHKLTSYSGTTSFDILGLKARRVNEPQGFPS